MQEFFETYNRYHLKLGLKLEVYHTSINDWSIAIGYKSTHPKSGETIVKVHSVDFEYAFAKAQVELKDWLSEHNGGY